MQVGIYFNLAKNQGGKARDNSAKNMAKNVEITQARIGWFEMISQLET